MRLSIFGALVVVGGGVVVTGCAVDAGEEPGASSAQATTATFGVPVGGDLNGDGLADLELRLCTGKPPAPAGRSGRHREQPSELLARERGAQALLMRQRSASPPELGPSIARARRRISPQVGPLGCLIEPRRW